MSKQNEKIIKQALLVHPSSKGGNRNMHSSMDDAGSRNRSNLGGEVLWSKLSSHEMDNDQVVISASPQINNECFVNSSIHHYDINQKQRNRKNEKQKQSMHNQSRNSKLTKTSILTPQPITNSALKVWSYESRLGKHPQY